MAPLLIQKSLQMMSWCYCKEAGKGFSKYGFEIEKKDDFFEI
jgi:hypothetical protein